MRQKSQSFPRTLYGSGLRLRKKRGRTDPHQAACARPRFQPGSARCYVPAGRVSGRPSAHWTSQCLLYTWQPEAHRVLGRKVHPGPAGAGLSDQDRGRRRQRLGEEPGGVGETACPGAQPQPGQGSGGGGGAGGDEGRGVPALTYQPVALRRAADASGRTRL